MVDYTLGATPISNTTVVSSSWGHSFVAIITTPVLLLGTGGQLRATDIPADILPPILATVTWGLDIDGGFDSLTTTEIRVLSGGLGTTDNGGATVDNEGFLAALEPRLETPISVFGSSGDGFLGDYFFTPDQLLSNPTFVGQNFDLFEIYGTNLLSNPTTVSGSFPMLDTRKSPALVWFDGTNYLTRNADDATLDNTNTLSCCVIFDPELLEPGQDCVVVAKNNETDTQAGWKVEWIASSGLVTVTVFNEVGATNSVARTTATALRVRSVLTWTWDSTGSPDLQLYLNGASDQGSQTDTGTPTGMASSTEPLSVGAHETSGTATDFMLGAVYLLAFWDDVLSQAEAESIDAHGSLPTALDDANLILEWLPVAIDTTGSNDNFHRWVDAQGGLDLGAGLTSAGIPRIIPGTDPLATFLFRNDWDTDFFDQSLTRTQNLSSTRTLSSDYPNRRTASSGSTPNIADTDNWRTERNDLTLIGFFYKGAADNIVNVFECYGLLVKFDRPTNTLTIDVGDDAGSGNVKHTFPSGSLPGFADFEEVYIAVKFNAVEDRVVIIVNGKTLFATTAGTSDKSVQTGLDIGDFLDFIGVIAIPACLSTAQVDQVVRGFQGNAESFTYGFEAVDRVANRYIPQDHTATNDLSGFAAFGLNSVVRYTGTDAEPPAVVTPLSTLRIDQRSSLLPSVIFGADVDDLLSFNFLDEPYPVQEGGGIDNGPTISLIFIDPLPTVVTVTANIAHAVVATANAGPTDAGTVISWWEVELVTGSEEAVIQFDYNPANSFAVNRNHIDTFTIPPGIDLDEKRIRFVVQAEADASQFWKSLFVRMEGDEFDNGIITTIVAPGIPVPSPPTVSDLEVAIQQSALVLRRESEVAGVTLNVSASSRYKLTRAFIDADRSRGAEFELLAVIDDFYTSGSSFRSHRVVSIDIGFLDRLAVQFFGPGNETLWWVIAYANAILDPETIQIGDELIIPTRAALRQFLARRPTTTV